MTKNVIFALWFSVSGFIFRDLYGHFKSKRMILADSFRLKTRFGKTRLAVDSELPKAKPNTKAASTIITHS